VHAFLEETLFCHLNQQVVGMSEVTIIPPHSCIPSAVHLLTQHSGLFLIFYSLPLVTG